jgi:hypothetical protein
LRHQRPIAPLLASALALTVGLAGCALGPRPTVSTSDLGSGATTGQGPIDAVLVLLDQGGQGAAFTAGYDVTRTFGPVSSTAKVTADATRRSVTVSTASTVVAASTAPTAGAVSTVRIITSNGTSTTCLFAPTASCTPGADVARLSDTGVTTPEFYAAGAARRLRRDAGAVVAPPTASTKTFAGQAATCVAVPLAPGTATFCALPSGVVAEQDDGSVRLTLTAFATTVDEALFSTATP